MATPYSAPRGNLPPNHPYASSSAGPSSYPSRQSSRDAFSYEQGGARADTERDRFGDAEGDCGRAADSDLQAEMTRFQPPPPRTMPHPHHQTYRQSPPTQPDPLSAQPFGHPTHPSGPSSSFSPGHELGTISRERLPSSTSVSSMSSAMRERKALIPAALDLSPQSERAMREAMAVAMREERYAAHGRLGQGLAPVGNLQGQRAVTDSYLDQVSSVCYRVHLPETLVGHVSAGFKTSSCSSSTPIYLLQSLFSGNLLPHEFLRSFASGFSIPFSSSCFGPADADDSVDDNGSSVCLWIRTKERFPWDWQSARRHDRGGSSNAVSSPHTRYTGLTARQP